MNVFNFLKPKASLSRNGFDLSQRHIYSLKAGQKIPVLCIDTLPSDYHEIDVLSLVRSMPVQTDAFTRLKCSFEFGFVPYWQVYRDWNEFITQTKEAQTESQYLAQLPTVVPTIGLDVLLKHIVGLAVQDLNGSTNNLDMFGFHKVDNALRMLDMLGYGSYYNIIEWLRIAYPDMEAADFQNLVTEILNHIDSTLEDKKINLFRICAYNKFMNDYCRSKVYEQSNPYYFDATAMDGDVDLVFDALSHIWYSLYRKDMFTALYPSPQFGSVSSVDLGTFQIVSSHPPVQGTGAGTNMLVQTDSFGGRLYNRVNSQETYNYDFSSTASIDVYQLRKAEMFQKWKEDKLRAGNSIKDQANAMWGQPFRYSLDEYSEYIKEVTFNVSIDEVTNLSASGGAQLGEIAGKGIGTGNGKVSFKCSDFGVLVCVMSIEPIVEYDALGLDKNNTLMEPFDFATPHFENLGLESVHEYQLNMNPFAQQSAGDGSLTLGYAPRYLNYKTAVDKVHGEFMGTGHGIFKNSVTVNTAGSLSSWTTPRVDMEIFQTGSSYPIEFLHINPSVLDSIFLVNADSTQQTDQFIVNTNFAVKSVRPLSVLGLPRW